MTDHLQAWTAYCEARIQHEQMDEAKKEAWKRFKLAEKQLVEAMLEADPPVTGIPDACGANASLRQSFSIRCNQENADDVEAWLQQEFGDAELFKKTALDKAAVQAKVKELADGGAAPDSFPDFLGVDSRPTIAVRGWEKKKAELGNG